MLFGIPFLLSKKNNKINAFASLILDQNNEIKFEIYDDDKKLVTEDNTGRWNLSQFKEVTYPIPDEMVKDKDHVRIKFVALDRSSAGPVYYVRLVKSK